MESIKNDKNKVNTKEEDELGELASGILEIMVDGYGFLRPKNYTQESRDIYISQSQIRRFNLKNGDEIVGHARNSKNGERYNALMRVDLVNGQNPDQAKKRIAFEFLTPIYPNERVYLGKDNEQLSMRLIDLISPIGKGQRGIIVAPPKAGKTTLLKDIALSVSKNYPNIKIFILLIDERPEEVTDIKEALDADNVEVIYSTFDEKSESHIKVAQTTLERAKRLTEQGYDTMILLDSLTRLTRANNLTVTPSGRTLSGGLDPASFYFPKCLFGAARNTREGGSLTILATALIETGSRMDDMVYEEFKGTGNMELVLSRKLQEKRIFPAIDVQKSGTRREDLLLSKDEYEAMQIIRKSLDQTTIEQATDSLLNMFEKTKDNEVLIKNILVSTKHQK
ncbi:transcription termination factor Rho [Erysipelatoclostridium ramosum]|uniref:transcription termination factor Rho n=1 Tax=Thomasclavelia ramosa TaxID=1547 RepID=UPI00189ED708|nr:transcription termination factor Rho [Thomasclavelia ramosa]MDB7039164.1 transcription termination factor Rho [Thomasclavelia ramosa]